MRHLQRCSSWVNVMRAPGLKVNKAGRHTDQARKVNLLPLHTQSLRCSAIKINVWTSFKLKRIFGDKNCVISIALLSMMEIQSYQL